VTNVAALHCTCSCSVAEFHSQTAVEAAQRLNKKLKAMGKTAEDIDKVVNRTHEACIRIIDKQFKPMENFADRDHCVQVRAIIGGIGPY
jgi:2-methylcitrate dehydratase